jgi:hypothetical protein
MKMKYKSIVAILLSMTIVSIAAMGCGSSKKNAASIESKTNMELSQNSNVAKDEAKLGDNGLNKSDTSTVKDKSKLENNPKDTSDGQGKIIRNGIIQMETLSFDETVEHILNKTNSIGAYVQSSNISGKKIEANSYEESRRGELILRIPKTKFDGFISDIGNLGSITNQQVSTQDVTAAYFDTQAHLKSLTIQEERLLELLKKTGELKDIIELEKELSSVRYEIESLTGNLRKWDNLVDFCTLNIEINEVHKIKENPVSFGDKIVTGFDSSVNSLIDFSKGFIVVISICIPYLVVLSILLLIIRYILIYKKRK